MAMLSATSAALFASSAQVDANTSSQAYDAAGAHVELGVLLFDAVHPGARYAVVTHADKHVEQEALLNATVLFAGQNITCGVEAGALFANNVPSLVARTQAQLQF